MMRRVYRALIMLVGTILTFLYLRNYEAAGRENVPKEGPLIVASNHMNNADPLFVTRALGRHPIFMAKKEMLELPVVGLAFRAWGTFPVRRGEFDLAAIRSAVDVLRQGDMLLMFPEGTRSRDGKLGRGHPGTAMIAHMANAPILPVAITGTEGIRWPAFFLRPRSVKRVRVVIGEPFRLPGGELSGEKRRAASDTVMRRIAELLPPEYRGEYAE